MTSIVLYSRPGCHLCETARDILDDLQKTYGFKLSELNIDEDEELFDKYCIDIPVVTIDKNFFCRYEIDVADLVRTLDRLMKETEK